MSPVASLAEAFKAFGGNTHAVGWAVLLMVVLAVFARAVDRRHFVVDLWTEPGVRTEAGLAMATLALGLILARITGTTFEGRYAAVMFPLFIAAAAFGITVFSSRTVRYSVLALLLIGGFWGGASNALRNRTQAFQISAAIDRDAKPNDLVVYCPDSIGTDVSRLLRDDVREVGLPGFRAPGRIDWTDYSKRVDAMRPVETMREIVKRAGDGHDIWLVYTSGSQPVQKQCGLIADALRGVPPDPPPSRRGGSVLLRAPGPVPLPPGPDAVVDRLPWHDPLRAAPTRSRQPPAQVPGSLRRNSGGGRARAPVPAAWAPPGADRLAHHRADGHRRHR